MQRGSKLRNYKITKLQNRRRSRGYILISLMLFLALLAIAALAVLPKMKFQVERDREQEMIHRGVAYERGIRRFYRKFGRYPTRIEELENTNNMRFIRKHYTDPINIVAGKEQEFKILRMTDVQLNLGQGFGIAPGVQNSGAPGVTLPAGTQPNQTTTGTSSAQSGGTATTVTPQTGSGTSDSSSSSSSSSTESSSSGFNGPTFGGGPMVGVASLSKKKTIREFCNKSHYKDWLFIYDPSTDRGGTLDTPWCPLAVVAGTGLNQTKTGTQQPNAGPQAAQPNASGPGTSSPPLNPTGNMPPEQ